MLREMLWPLRSLGSKDEGSEASLGSHIEHMAQGNQIRSGPSEIQFPTSSQD